MLACVSTTWDHQERRSAARSPGQWALGLVLSLTVCASWTSCSSGATGRRGAGNEHTDSAALFAAAAVVFQHPRCLNCHPADDFPRQGMDGRRHALNVQRGPDGQGVPAMRCSTCHQDANQDHAGVPGAPKWALAPRSMAWTGLSAGEICRAILDPARNGKRSLAQTVEHLTEDALVAWAWNPGKDREPPPVPYQEFRALIQQWAATGAACPE